MAPGLWIYFHFFFFMVKRKLAPRRIGIQEADQLSFQVRGDEIVPRYAEDKEETVLPPHKRPRKDFSRTFSPKLLSAVHVLGSIMVKCALIAEQTQQIIQTQNFSCVYSLRSTSDSQCHLFSVSIVAGSGEELLEVIVSEEKILSAFSSHCKPLVPPSSSVLESLAQCMLHTRPGFYVHCSLLVALFC